MSDQETPATPSPHFPFMTMPWLEAASKNITVLAVVLYGCGFLVTSISSLRYGFVEMNPFRPRIGLAGAWFLMFVALSLALVLWTRKASLNAEGEENKLGQRLLYYAILSSGFAWVLRTPFESDPSLPTWRSYLAVLLMPGYIGLGFLDSWNRRWRATGQVLAIALVVVTAVIGFADAVQYQGESTNTLITWFLVEGWMISILLYNYVDRPAAI